VSVAREAPDDSAVNHVRAPIASLVNLGNRVRVRIGPVTAEITAQSAERLALREGDVVVASFKATGARALPA
jgi:molybdopterin-binding protein